MVRQIRERPFVLKSKGKIWWSFNNAPSVRDTSNGFWRRIKLIPFNRTFSASEVDKDLKEKITKPQILSAIFNDAITAYNAVLRSGVFTKSSLIDSQTEIYKESENVVQSFLKDSCKLDKNLKVKSSELYRHYKDWCNQYGYRHQSIKNFKSEMKRLGHLDRRLSSGMFFMGLEVEASFKASRIW